VVDGDPAVEHLWALGREAFGEEADCWVVVGGEGRAGHPGVRGGSGEESGWSAEVARTAEYFRERRVQMESPAFRKAGYPIGSGTVESACTGIGWRCKGRGQRWKAKGWGAIFALRRAGRGGQREWTQAGKQMDQAA